MNIEEALYAHVTGDASIAALISDRFYPLRAPQGAALPYAVYQRISTPRIRSQSGPSGLARPRFQVTCYASSYSQSRQLANLMRISLDGFRGTMGGGVSVGAVFLENEMDTYEDETGAFGTPMDFIIWHQEATE